MMLLSSKEIKLRSFRLGHGSRFGHFWIRTPASPIPLEYDVSTTFEIQFYILK